MPKILCVCAQGLSRSVGLADVLKLHFEPVDVIPVGYKDNANSAETLEMLTKWADHIIFMQPYMEERFEKKTGYDPLRNYQNVHICDVGQDTYHWDRQGRAVLIDKVWQWARANQDKLGIKEHFRHI